MPKLSPNTIKLLLGLMVTLSLVNLCFFLYYVPLSLIIGGSIVVFIAGGIAGGTFNVELKHCQTFGIICGLITVAIFFPMWALVFNFICQAIAQIITVFYKDDFDSMVAAI